MECKECGLQMVLFEYDKSIKMWICANMHKFIDVKDTTELPYPYNLERTEPLNVT